MTTAVLGISIAYAGMGLLLLAMGMTSRFAWWVKAAAIVVTSLFFIQAFYATKGLLGWPGSERLPARFQLLWARVVEPDAKIGDAGAVYLWIEELDENNVPETDRWLVLTPTERQILMQSNLAQAQFMGDDSSAVRNGKIGKIDRFTVYVSNQLPKAAAGTATAWTSGKGDETSVTSTGTVLKRRAIIAGHKSEIGRAHV